MLDVEKESVTEAEAGKVEVSPYITVDMQNKELLTLQIQLHLEISSNHSNRDIQIGEALLHLVDEQWVSGSLIDHVIYKANHSHIKNKIYFKNLQLSLESLAQSKTKSIGTIAFMHHVIIDEHYRGNGFAKAFLWLILRFLKEKEINNILLQAYPLNMKDVDKIMIVNAQKRLERMYLKAGFHILKTKKRIKSDEGLRISCMFCNIEKRDFSQFK